MHRFSSSADRPSEPTASRTLASGDGDALLRLARLSLECAVHGRRPPSLEDAGIHPTPALVSTMGGFVTLKIENELRGCIGEIFPRRAIWQVVREQARNAALEDPRFDAVRPPELDFIAIEISALTPPRPVSSWHDIEIGRHGIVLQKAGAAAVFLPQVATEQGWDLETTLSHLSMKAGLRAEAWRSGATFDVFEAEVFHERRG